MASAPSIREVLGRRPPPARAAGPFSRLRSRLGRAHDRMVPPQVTIIERSLALLDTRFLGVAVELNVPDLLADGPRRSSDLATELIVDADAFDRLLRFLVTRDVFKITQDGRYANNAVSDYLRTDHPYSWRPWVAWFGSVWNWDLVRDADAVVRTGRGSALATTGQGFFDYIQNREREAGAAFDGAMTSGARLQGACVREAYDFAGVKRVCDVGGGTGVLLADLLIEQRNLRGVLFDLPTVVVRAEAVMNEAGASDRVELVGGTFFETMPDGCDIYMLYAIVHDWGDDEAAKILTNVREAMTPGARVLVVESELPEHPRRDAAETFDALMLMLSDSGRERTRAQFESLGARAGLRLNRVIPLPIGTFIHEYVVA